MGLRDCLALLRDWLTLGVAVTAVVVAAASYVVARRIKLIEEERRKDEVEERDTARLTLSIEWNRGSGTHTGGRLTVTNSGRGPATEVSVAFPPAEETSPVEFVDFDNADTAKISRLAGNGQMSTFRIRVLGKPEKPLKCLYSWEDCAVDKRGFHNETTYL